jgi:hypothetical protein
MNAKATQRAEVILKVRSGQMTATAGAQALGISRQQYYQWEQRGLRALLASLADQPTGRPKAPTDPEKASLQHRVKQLEEQVQQYQQQAKLRQLLQQWAAKDDLPPAKKTPNDPATPASTRHHEASHPPLLAAAVH